MNIFKLKLLAFAAVTALILAAANAGATVMTFTDKVDPNPDQLISFGNNLSYNFIHNIIFDQDDAGTLWSGIYGYNSLTDIISGVSSAIRFKDESNDDVSESVQLVFDAQSYGTETITSGGAIYTYTANFLSGWNTLLTDGILNVTLQNAGITSGHQDDRSDFLFLDSTLTVDIDRRVQAQQIPEPAPLFLLFLGLASLVLSRRKFF